MLADALLLYGSIIGAALLVAAAVHIAGRLSTPTPPPPRFRERFQKLWYSADTRRIYGYIWQQNVWYEISYSGVRTVSPAVPALSGLWRADGGPPLGIDDTLLSVLQYLWWIQNGGDLPHVRQQLNDFIINQERRRP